MWSLLSIKIQSGISHQCVLWYHWGWTKLLCHLRTVPTVPLKNIDWNSVLQLSRRAGEDLHLDRLVVSWYDWNVLCLCCLIVRPSSGFIYEEWALSVYSQAECWHRMGYQWVPLWTVWDPLLWIRLLQSVFRSGCPWLLEIVCSGVENSLCSSHSTFQFELLASGTSPLLLRTQRFWSQDNCCTKLLCQSWHLLF